MLQWVIIPEATRDAVSQSRPVVVVVAGRPGAGKTAVADLVQALLAHRGGRGAVRPGSVHAAHLHYSGLLAADVRTAGTLLGPDTTRWQAAVEAHIRDRGFDAVVESALADPDDVRASSLAQVVRKPMRTDADSEPPPERPYASGLEVKAARTDFCADGEILGARNDLHIEGDLRHAM